MTKEDIKAAAGQYVEKTFKPTLNKEGDIVQQLVGQYNPAGWKKQRNVKLPAFIAGAEWMQSNASGTMPAQEEDKEPLSTVVTYCHAKDVKDGKVPVNKTWNAMRSPSHSPVADKEQEERMFTLEDMKQIHMKGQYSAGCFEPSTSEALVDVKEYLQSLK